ncbi:TonB-dependent receptor [Longimicrobium sp.]|uniref:TonB-dependent receptor n=1 Tax=Longimicrobium sp. TaxID=2029185 RepID=UPI002C1D3DEE|nr:TonB-dependent receptor [Longimicrobium sp.]HSU14026.1 TonB-dependent receptor [Longimicrobium sp.]
MRTALLVIALLLISRTPLLAQFPGELAGTVTDAATGAPVAAAAVELAGTALAARTDGAGAFRLRGLEPGSYHVVIRRAGYALQDVAATVRNGETARISITLQPVPVTLSALTVTAEAEAAGGSVGRAEIEASGARTAAEVVERVPGVVVRGSGPTGARTVSIRGSAADEVLVLVDGAALNDPVTGEADLSAVPASSVERVTVLPGARTARYGPRAQAGVVLVETRAAAARQSLELSAGTLGEWSGGGEMGMAVGRTAWSAGGHLRRIGGGFDYLRDANDPTRVRRTNDDLGEWSAFGAVSSPLAGGELRVRGGWDALRRGLPGTGHTPSPDAREEMGRGRASLGWRRVGARTTLSARVTGAAQRVRFADPAPPFGLPYDDTTRVRTGDVRVEAERALGDVGLVRTVGGGIDAGAQHVDAGALSDRAPRTRHDFGAFAHAAGGISISRLPLDLSAEGRVDRDGVAREWFASRALAAGTRVGALRVQVANRSSFSPPSLGDQFFREGVGVVPNPALRPERVPSEWEISSSLGVERGGAGLTVSAAGYTGDVKGMIVWLPDFAFRWSPRNVDVARRGMDARAEANFPAAGLRVAGSWSIARITYILDGRDSGIQVAYRPARSGLLTAAWAPGPWRAELAARYTGLRYPAPAKVNALPGFWSADLGVSRAWRLGRWAATGALTIDRIFDEKQSLIAGYPEPGRRVRFDLRLTRAGIHHP